jgi:hypothetical protein
MTKKAATEDKLGELHSKVADVMLKALDNYDQFNEKELQRTSDDEDAGPALPLEPSAALIGAITKFLKDNDITCNTKASPAMTKLQDQLAKKARVSASVVPLRDMPVTEDVPQKRTTAKTDAVDDDLKALGLG